jgi:OOP family OmpA-OmpF porin
MKTSKKLLLNALALTILCNTAMADDTNRAGYLLDSRGALVRTPAGLCIHTGYWTPAMAIAECDGTPVKKAVPVAEVDSTPIAAPSLPVTVRRVVYTPYTAAETLFAYNKAEISADGKQQNVDIGMMKKYPITAK